MVVMAFFTNAIPLKDRELCLVKASTHQQIFRTSPLNKPAFLFRGVAENQQNPLNCYKSATFFKGIIYLFAFFHHHK
jgi:hypothetical protein